MARDSDRSGNSFEAENTGGLLNGFLADEEDFDRRSLWRLGSWGVGTVAAVVMAVLANQSAFKSRLDQVATDDLARQAQQFRTVAKDSQNEARRLASAVDTLNGDRDRLYARVTVLEQGLDTVTGAIARQTAAASPPQAAPAPAEPPPSPQNTAPAPVVAPVATTAPAPPEKPAASAATEPVPATVASVEPAASPAKPDPSPAIPLVAAKSIMAPPDSAAGKLIEPATPASAIIAAPIPEVVASIPPADNAESDKLAVQRTEFGVDLGTAKSLTGLRALWRGLLKSNSELAPLRPIIAIRENNRLGMQLRLVVGPLRDAAAAAKICAALLEGQRTCETTLFDGQRLVMRPDAPSAPAAVKQGSRKRSAARRPASPVDPPRKPEVSTLSALFSRR